MANGGWRCRWVWSVSVAALAAGCSAPATHNGPAAAGFGLGSLPFNRPAPQVAAAAAPPMDVVPWTFWDNDGIDEPGTLYVAYGRWQEELGRLTEAGESYERALRENDESVAALLGLARIDQLSGREAEAEKKFRKAVRLRPDDPHTHDALGEFLASAQRWPEALEELNAAVRLAPERSEFRYHLAVALVRSGDAAGAMVHFTKTVGDAEAHYNIGYLQYQQGRYDDAERQFLQAVLKRPDLLEAQRMLDEIRARRANHMLAANDNSPPPPPRSPLVPLHGWPHRDGRQTPAPALDPARSHIAGYGEPGQNLFIPASYEGAPARMPTSALAAEPHRAATPRR